MFLRLFIATLAVLFALAAPAVAVDPECVDAQVRPPDLFYDASDHISFCTPVEDINGTVLISGDLVSCRVVTGAGVEALVATPEPGSYVVLPTPDAMKEAGPKGSFEAFCSTAAGISAPAVATDVRFQGPGVPGPPTLLP
jgi:hypothetical protein